VYAGVRKKWIWSVGCRDREPRDQEGTGEEKKPLPSGRGSVVM
jgi:hypothetical protein